MRAFYSGDVVDVGHDEDGRWVDVRVIDYTLEKPAELKSSRDALFSSFRDEIRSVGNGPVPLELRERFIAAFQMTHAVQEVVGDRVELPKPEGTTRFYDHQLGKSPLTRLIKI
jgi:hypothetical protein